MVYDDEGMADKSAYSYLEAHSFGPILAEISTGANSGFYLLIKIGDRVIFRDDFMTIAAAKSHAMQFVTRLSEDCLKLSDSIGDSGRLHRSAGRLRDQDIKFARMNENRIKNRHHNDDEIEEDDSRDSASGIRRFFSDDDIPW